MSDEEDIPNPWERAAGNAERAQGAYWDAFRGHAEQAEDFQRSHRTGAKPGDFWRQFNMVWCVGGPLHHKQHSAANGNTITHEVAGPVNGQTGVQSSMVHTYKLVRLMEGNMEQAYMWVGAVKVTRGDTPRRSVRITQITGLST